LGQKNKPESGFPIQTGQDFTLGRGASVQTTSRSPDYDHLLVFDRGADGFEVGLARLSELVIEIEIFHVYLKFRT